MLRSLVGLCVMSVLVLPALAVDPDKDKPDTKEVKSTKEKLVSAGKLVGKLTRLETGQKFFTVDVNQKIAVPNPQALQTLANLQGQLAQATRSRDVNQIASIQRQMAQQQVITLKDHNLKFELEASDDVKVRTMLLPQEFDDKGKPKKYTPKELKDLQGPDPKLKGYLAEFDNLKAGQIVEVYLLKSKTAPKTAKPKDKDKDFVAGDDNKPKVSMIVILGEPPR